LTRHTSTSFACDLKKWLQIMETYRGGGHAYHATMPTDALTAHCGDVMLETEAYGFDKVRKEQQELGRASVRCSPPKGFPSVAAPKASRHPAWSSATPTDPEIQSGKKFLAQGLQTPPACRCSATNRPISAASASGCSAWRSCSNVDRTVQSFAEALNKVV
jgi:aspartate aminotransferase-like enzyme